VRGPGGGGRRSAVGLLVGALVTVLVLAGCVGSPSRVPPVSDAGPAGLYVALGASDAVGVGAERPTTQSWPQVLYREAMPRATVFVNLAVEGSTVGQALAGQIPEALRLEPSVATVSFGVNDLRAGVEAGEFERGLGELVRLLRRGGATRVLVGNVPPVDRLPAYLADGGRTFPPPAEVVAVVARYNEAITRVAGEEGAELVDLWAAGQRARSDGSEPSLVSADGFHPSTEGHVRIAKAFAAVL
jgi:acyl-CoA thioesterase I